MPSASDKPPSGHSKAYSDGYKSGFAAGRAAGRKQASAHCAAPAKPRQNAADAGLDSPSQMPEVGVHPFVPEKQMTPRAKAGPMPLPMRGSYSSLERQNVHLEKDGLERIEDQHDLDGRIASKLLVPLPASEGLVVNPKLPADRRYCRPWTARFLSDLAAAHEAAFHEPLEVNSAVRTVAYQKRLRRSNGNAAPAKGEVVSPHLTGAAVDIAKEQLTRQEISWMRSQLLPLQKAGKIDVEEEFQQACFHITVYKGYQSNKSHGKPASPAQNPEQHAAVRNPTPDRQPVKTTPQAANPRSPKPTRKSAPEPTEVVVIDQ